MIPAVQKTETNTIQWIRISQLLKAFYFVISLQIQIKYLGTQLLFGAPCFMDALLGEKKNIIPMDEKCAIGYRRNISMPALVWSQLVEGFMISN